MSTDYPDRYRPDPRLRKAWIVDMDGTLALGRFGEPGRRGPFDWHRVGEDAPNPPVIRVVNHLYRAGDMIVIVSGRMDTPDGGCRRETALWLTRHGVGFHRLHMRADGDNRPDTEVKLEMFWERVAPFWQVQGVLDDRDSVVAMWRGLGLTCFQVAPGNF